MPAPPGWVDPQPERCHSDRQRPLDERQRLAALQRQSLRLFAAFERAAPGPQRDAAHRAWREADRAWEAAWRG